MRCATTAVLAAAVLAVDVAAWSKSSYWYKSWSPSGGSDNEGPGNEVEFVTTIVYAPPTVPTTLVKTPKYTSPPDSEQHKKPKQKQEKPAPSYTQPPAPKKEGGSGGSSYGLSSAQKAALNDQNDARKEVGVEPLEWDDDLAADAQKWADHLASINDMVHSTGDERPDQGENLYAGSYPNPYTEACKLWIDEKGSMGGHYTQIVWKSTKKVGMAVATSGDQSYVVARYSPPGNVIGENPY